MTVHLRVDGKVAVITLDYPPVNALSVGAGLVGSLREAVRTTIADPSVEAIVLTGAGALFSGGADITDFSGDTAELELTRTTLNEIEAAAKPVVIALNGTALGGGLELAMVGHYRIATRKAKLGLPEVSLGLLPGAGGTQRLPRLVGVPAAIDMMVGGRPISAEEGVKLGLLDRVVDGDAVAAALSFVAETGGLRPRPTGQLPVPDAAPAAIAAARAALKAGALNAAPGEIIDCAEAASTLGLTEGLAFEAARFTTLLASEASLGLRHAFFGQRAVARIPNLPEDVTPLRIAGTAVVGGGLMGTGIALALLNAGLPVTLVEARADALAKAEATIAATINRDVAKGRLSTAAAAARLALLRPTSALADVAQADLVIEAVFEEMGVKQQIFRALDDIAKPSAILASNTSTLDLNVIASATRRPDRVVGLHFFSPANIMRLLEIVRGAATSPSVLVTAMAFARQIGKVGVVAGVCDGFIGNRLFEECLRQAFFLAEEGALPQQIDAALERWGMAMGPHRTLDLAGQDIGWSIRKRRAVEQPDRPYSTFPDRLCELGRFGQKTGRGIYRYADGRAAEVDPEVEAMLIAHSAESNIERRRIDDREIIDRCILTMVNEGARLLEEGIAYRPVDIDIVFLNGYGFPSERGGPMFHADRLGLPRVLERIRELAGGRHGWVWKPAPLLVDLVSRGASFASLNR